MSNGNRRRRNFCDIHPFFYTISLHKEIAKRNIKDFFSKSSIFLGLQVCLLFVKIAKL